MLVLLKLFRFPTIITPARKRRKRDLNKDDSVLDKCLHSSKKKKKISCYAKTWIFLGHEILIWKLWETKWEGKTNTPHF